MPKTERHRAARPRRRRSIIACAGVFAHTLWSQPPRLRASEAATNRKFMGRILLDWRQIFLHVNWGLLVGAGNGEDGEEANAAFAHMHGYTLAEVAGKSILDMTAPAALDDARGHMVLGELRDNYQFDSVHLHKDGHIFPVQVDVTNITDAASGIRYRLVGVHDISEHRKIETALERTREQLRALSAYQEQSLEEERKRIAREVHDELGQKLVAMQMGLATLRLRYGGDPELCVKVGELHALVENTIDVVRHVASNLRPAALDLGLAQAIDWLAEDFSHRWEIPCTVETGEARVELDDVVATAVFRVVQESLTNVSRHARASKVAISLQADRHELHLLVRDDGQGFDPAAVRKERGFGLLGMRERVLALGGRLHIDSSLGQGTAVVIDLPLHSQVKR